MTRPPGFGEGDPDAATNGIYGVNGHPDENVQPPWLPATRPTGQPPGRRRRPNWAKVIAEWRRQCGESCSHAPIPAVRARRRTSSHRWPWRSLPQQRPGQLPPLPRPGPLRPGGQVGLQGRHRGRGEGPSPSARPCGPRAAPGSRSPRPGRRRRRRRPHRRAGRVAAAAAPRPRCAAPGRRCRHRRRRPGPGPGPGPGRRWPCSPDPPPAGPRPGWAPGRSGHGPRSTSRTPAPPFPARSEPRAVARGPAACVLRARR